MGVSVFVLCDTELPEDIAESYNDGFEPLAKRLYSDIGSNIKLLEAVEVSLKGKDEKDGKITNAAIKKEIGEFDTRTFEVRARPDAPVQGLRPGMSVILQKSAK